MTLSVVIVIASDTVRRPGHAGHLRRCLAGLRTQERAPLLDIVVPHLPGIDGIDDLAAEFPEVRFLEVTDLAARPPRGPYRDHHDDLRTRGLAITAAGTVAMLEDHETPDPHWAARIAAAHAAGTYAAVGGAVENAVDRPLNRAVCLCDFWPYLNPVPEGSSPIASDVNVSYRRDALDDVFEVWRSRFNERRVHAALLSRGHRLALSPQIVVHQQRIGLLGRDAVIERFVWGRSYAVTRAGEWSAAKRLIYAAGALALPAILVARIVRTLIARRRLSGRMLLALPWVCLLSWAWSLGECAGYLSTRRSGVPVTVDAGLGPVRTS